MQDVSLMLKTLHSKGIEGNDRALVRNVPLPVSEGLVHLQALRLQEGAKVVWRIWHDFNPSATVNRS